MASAQVLSSSRKQEHLEAGKRRLEEFRKKKAADRAQKASASGQSGATHGALEKKQPLESEDARRVDSDGAGMSNGPIVNVVGPPSLLTDDVINSVSKPVQHSSLKGTDASPHTNNDYYTYLIQRDANNYDLERESISGSGGITDVRCGQDTDKLNYGSRLYGETQGGIPYGISADNSTDMHTQASQGFSSFIQSSTNSLDTLQQKQDSSFQNFSSPLASAYSQLQPTLSSGSVLPISVDSVQNSSHHGGTSFDFVQDTLGSSRFNNVVNSSAGERNFSTPARSLPTLQTFESSVTSSDDRSSTNRIPLYPTTFESNSRKSRPSFLDSLNVSRGSFRANMQRNEPQKDLFMHVDSKSDDMEISESSVFQKPQETDSLGLSSKLRPSSVPDTFELSVPSSDGFDAYGSNVIENNVMKKHEFYPPKQNEDFSALEQHIEDLTQEKFSLQRALEASRALAESLAAENSSLTETYNQQRSVVNQLKSDMEMLQEEIKAHLAQLDAVKIEYENAQLECNAADERAKILASEVISLEEKALRLRSNELKLEKQLENSYAEIASYKKKMSSLEKDRKDLQSTIEALQEEKKLLQSKLRKASVSGKSIDNNRSTNTNRDVSTTTDDLDAVPETSNLETHDTIPLPTTGFPVPGENGLSNIDVLSFYIPPDQIRMIQNINELLSELALEKEELAQALASKSSQCLQLQDLNMEMSRKLEAQTQRLEFLTAQRMASGQNPPRVLDSLPVPDNTPYADEGDEVVERVLGWIMKLFPGGPSRRRTSKHL